MPQIQRRWCPDCERHVGAIRQYPNFGLHALLLIMSCGLYLPVWLFVMSSTLWACPTCGRRV